MKTFRTFKSAVYGKSEGFVIGGDQPTNQVICKWKPTDNFNFLLTLRKSSSTVEEN